MDTTSKFVQIACRESGVFALDELGQVWELHREQWGDVVTTSWRQIPTNNRIINP